MEELFEKLKENRDSGMYPLHMPGHKRQPCGSLPAELYGLDITEIDGFDNLHQPEGILLRLMQEAAGLYGAEESFYLVNGSTAGILSAVSAVLPRGGHILMARNCHKSAYHAAYLRNLRVTYLYPDLFPEFDIFDKIGPEQVQRKLEEEPDIGAVLLVSPTYEGRIQDIRALAETVHEKGIPLIVDEAHGAHLGFGGLPVENSCRAGADLVIHSVHKTLPALTQSALLHVNGNLVDRRKLRRFLQIYQTSSPSYLLMAGIDNALQFVKRDGAEAFRRFESLYDDMMRKLNACRCLKILPWDRKRQDIGKLVVSVKGTGISGRGLYDLLRERYQLQPEMASESFVLAMFTVNDAQEGYERMTRALLEIDRRLAEQGTQGTLSEKTACVPEYGTECQPECAVPLPEAWDMDVTEAELEASIGKCAGEFVNLYPPGVPVLVPGECFSAQLCRSVKNWVKAGLTVQGVRVQDDKIYVKVLTDR